MTTVPALSPTAMALHFRASRSPVPSAPGPALKPVLLALHVRAMSPPPIEVRAPRRPREGGLCMALRVTQTLFLAAGVVLLAIQLKLSMH